MESLDGDTTEEKNRNDHGLQKYNDLRQKIAMSKMVVRDCECDQVDDTYCDYMRILGLKAADTATVRGTAEKLLNCSNSCQG